MMPDANLNWPEESSTTYRELAAIAVPSRAEQTATLLTLIPFARAESFHALELGCGQGFLAHSLLAAFPQATVLALDGSDSMRAEATRRLQPFGRRATVQAFDLFSEAWLTQAQNPAVVLSSLCLHHLDAAGKQRLFARLADLLGTRGALLIADLIMPSSASGRRLFADTWDRSASAQARAAKRASGLFEKFVNTQWNYFRFPDEVDKPSGLFEQLQWLQGAGFSAVDCFWMRAGHAIYGGYKDGTQQSVDGISFAEALRAAGAALAA
jgi:trans-aconitate methyltransferase